MALLIGRVELDAARLWRDHPPRIHHLQKRALLDLAGGLERIPRGALVVTRWTPGELPRVGPQTKAVSIDGPFTYPRAAADVDSWHVNFADTHLFAFYGGPAFAQDEIQVAEHPVLASLRVALESSVETIPPLTRTHDRPTPILVRNVERWCAIDTYPELAMPYGIYGQRLGRASDAVLKQAVSRLEDAPASNIIAVVAPQGSGHYTADQIRDVVVTATSAFEAARAESTRRLLRIHTGHWGTGVFGGNRVLMAAAQIVAARIAGIDELLYYSLDEDAARAFEEGRAAAEQIDEGAPLDDVVGALDARGFVWGSSDGN